MRLADYVADFVAARACRVYGVCGAGAMHLNDAFASHPHLQVVATHHEQAATYAAEAEARLLGKTSFVSVTTGPGGSNTLTGVACAYVDSIPMMIIAGQVTSSTMRDNGIRQRGMNELDMVAMMQPVTKLAMTLTDHGMVRYWLEKLYHVARDGRPGPVFIEIPLDVQAAEIDPASLMSYVPVEPELMPPSDLDVQTMKLCALLRHANRPLVLVGNGVRLAGGCNNALSFINKINVPVITSWGAADIIPSDHHLLLGHCGLFGDRASNFATQNCDLLIVLGSRLSVGQVGHSPKEFAKQARKVIVDIDYHEVHKWNYHVDLPVINDVLEFIFAAIDQPDFRVYEHHTRWVLHCQGLRDKHPPGRENSIAALDPEGVIAYNFIQELSASLDEEAIIVTDVGFCFIPTFQSLRLKRGQRLLHSGGVSPMGWGIPAAVGAAMATGRHIVCLTGDGGAMMNIQELQTIAHHQLPITIFVFDNNGYATMQIAQRNHFKREVMSGPNTGVSMPRFSKVGQAFGLSTMEFHSHDELVAGLVTALKAGKSSPMLATLHMTPGQTIAPRLMARMQDGQFLPTKFDDMWPFIEPLTYSNIEEEEHAH